MHPVRGGHGGPAAAGAAFGARNTDSCNDIPYSGKFGVVSHENIVSNTLYLGQEWFSYREVSHVRRGRNRNRD